MLFVAGLQGTGHHFWCKALKEGCSTCGSSGELRMALGQLWGVGRAAEQQAGEARRLTSRRDARSAVAKILARATASDEPGGEGRRVIVANVLEHEALSGGMFSYPNGNLWCAPAPRAEAPSDWLDAGAARVPRAGTTQM